MDKYGTRSGRPLHENVWQGAKHELCLLDFFLWLSRLGHSSCLSICMCHESPASHMMHVSWKSGMSAAPRTWRSLRLACVSLEFLLPIILTLLWIRTTRTVWHAHGVDMHEAKYLSTIFLPQYMSMENEYLQIISDPWKYRLLYKSLLLS
jgi:hypothetical protein